MNPLWKSLALASFVFIGSAAQGEMRTYAGTFSSNWKTFGPHGHDQPWCAGPRLTYYPGIILWQSPNCNPADFARGNLDNSIGFRAGREHDHYSLGPFSLVSGIEGSLSYTEYNLTQADFVFAAATATTGVDLQLGRIRVGGRLGAGPFATSDGGEYGFQRFRGAHITIPLHAGTAIRISQQSMKVFATAPPRSLYGLGREETGDRREPNAVETSILLVSSPEYIGDSRWDFSATTGITSPGGPLGGSRGLRQSNFSRIVAIGDLPWADLQGRVSWTTSAHESQFATIFRGYDGNFRSKTVDGFGLGIGQSRKLSDHFSACYGAGVEVADWRDEHHLLTRDGKSLVAGVETALAAQVGLRWHFGRNLALETSFEKIYWNGIDLGETRLGFGLVITR